MLLLSGRGVGEGYQGDEMASARMDKLQSLVVDTCDLFIALTVAVHFWGYGVHVTVSDDDQEEDKKCVCVCVCVCVSVSVGERQRRVKVQRTAPPPPPPPPTALVNHLQPFLPSSSAAAGLPTRVQSDGGGQWRAARTSDGAVCSDYTKLLPHKMSQ